MALRITLIATLLLATPAVAYTPIAEVICAPRAQMENRLTRQYRATRAATGLRDAEAMIEVWSDPQGRWTLVQRNANGTSCILAMGEAWYTVDPA